MLRHTLTCNHKHSPLRVCKMKMTGERSGIEQSIDLTAQGMEIIETQVNNRIADVSNLVEFFQPRMAWSRNARALATGIRCCSAPRRSSSASRPGRASRKRVNGAM